MKEKQRVEDILQLGKTHGFNQEASDFIRDEKSMDDFRHFILAQLAKKDKGPVMLADNNYWTRSGERPEPKTPILDAVTAQISEYRQSDSAARAAALHKEMTGVRPESGNRAGLRVPTGDMTRGLATNVGTAGGYLVAEDLSSSFIESLTNETVAIKMGAKALHGLVGDVAIPKQTGGTTAYFVSEGGDLTASQPTLGQLRMTPKTVGAYCDISRRMLLQSSLDIEGFIRGELAKQIGVAIDAAILNGSASNGQPRGILQTDGIGTVATGSVSLAKVIELVQDLADNNALRGKLGFAMDSATCGSLCQTPVISSTDSRMLMNSIPATGEEARLLGHKVLVSNQLTNQIIFGDWSQVVVGFWSGLDILVDSTTLGTSGALRVIAFQDFDVTVRHAESFSSLAIS